MNYTQCVSGDSSTHSTVLSCEHLASFQKLYLWIHMHVEDLCKFSCKVPDCIHSLVLPDELNELLDSQTELKTALPKNQRNVSEARPQKS